MLKLSLKGTGVRPCTVALEHPYFDSLDKSQFAKIEAQFEKENRKNPNMA